MTERSAQPHEQRPRTGEAEAEMPSLLSADEVVVLVSTELPQGEQYTPEALQGYIDQMRELTRQNKISIVGRTFVEATETATNLAALIAERHPELTAGLQSKEILATVTYSVRLAYREAALRGDRSMYARDRFQALDQYHCYALAVAAVRDAAALAAHGLSTAPTLVQYNSANFLISLIQDERYCELTMYQRKQLIRYQARNPEEVIQKATGRVKELLTLAAQHNIPFSKTNTTNAVVVGLEPRDVVRNVQIAMNLTKDMDNKIITPALVRQFCCSYKEPLAEMQAFYIRATGLIEAHEKGAFPDLSERQLVRMAVVSPKNVDALLARTEANMEALKTQFKGVPGFTEATMRQLAYLPEPIVGAERYIKTLRYLEGINRQSKLGAKTSTLRALALGGNALDPEELRYEITLARVREETMQLNIPLWLVRIMVRTYGDAEYPVEAIREAVAGAATLMEHGALQSLILERNEEVGINKVDNKTCYYLAFSEGDEFKDGDIRRATAHIFGELDFLFYGSDVSNELQTRHGARWREKLLPARLRTVAGQKGITPVVALQKHDSASAKSAILPESDQGEQPVRIPRTNSRDYEVGVSKDIDMHDLDWLFDRIEAVPEDIVERNINNAKTIEIGLYAEKVYSGELPLSTRISEIYSITDGIITSELAEDLAEAIRQKNVAIEEMKTQNLKLVVKFATYDTFKGRGLTTTELINEGTLGLIHAIQKFDYKKGFTLSTYASNWIKQAIVRGIHNTGRLVRLPVPIEDERASIFRTRSILEAALGRSPTTDEIAEAQGSTADRVKFLIKAGMRPASFDEPALGTDLNDGLTLANTVEDPHSEEAYNNILEDIDKSYLLDYLKTITYDFAQIESNRSAAQQVPAWNHSLRLNMRELNFLIDNYGLEGSEPLNGNALAKKYHLTHSGVSTFRSVLLAKMRHILRQYA